MSDVKFDPSRFLTLVSGKEYLEVRWRLVWLRSEHPEAIIDTDLVSHQGSAAVFRAYIKIPNGGSATGYGSEDAQGFGDYLEKAETKAIGRALAALGYGTQFCGDFDFGAAAGRVVDAPTQMPQRAPQDDNVRDLARQVLTQPHRQNAPQAGPGGATEKQIGAIRAMAKKLSVPTYPDEELQQMSRQEASNLIEQMQAQLNSARPEAMA